MADSGKRMVNVEFIGGSRGREVGHWIPEELAQRGTFELPSLDDANVVEVWELDDRSSRARFVSAWRVR